MAVVVDQQPKFKHFCRICKKGFGCGRALGGHMRAHGIGDENIILDDEDTSNDTDDNEDQHHPPSNKRMYALRTNPNRFKNCRICENCGMEFSSWKAFLEHGKCSSSRGYGDELNNHVITPQVSDEEDGVARTWSKGIRSKRAKVGFNSNNMMNCPSTEEEDLANCLVLLSSAQVDHPIFIAETEESCASASKEENKRRKPNGFYMSSGTDHYNSHHQLLLQSSYDHNNSNKAKGLSSKGLFECKACKKVFNSHQALGGHRASHKKVKGCFAAKNEMHQQQQQYQNDDQSILMDEDVITNDEYLVSPKSTMNINQSFERESYGGSPSPMTSKRKSKVHECSICHRVFSSGQALGGHKRCHWVTSNSPDNTSISISFHHQQQLKDRNQNFHDFHKRSSSSSQFYNTKQIVSEDLQLSVLDLNLPAPPSVGKGENNKLGFEVPWIGLSTNNNANENNADGQIPEMRKTDDENDEEQNQNNNVKLAKLSDLKDMKMGDNGSSSPWLQVGIGSSTTDNNV
ncbi:hypothetical protein C5167_032306 [Papaver somniferum]|uniref:C2H2-type domain-containing protein n=1 Tax=Papaver somniferum TaxID=3469 RepID=A0A4Y7KAG8_PAPSO|nr:zinc finger protein ZAT9-like [Papaver somniferum]RZC69201.1 hypothetical protein C5167_032306 [Papaver somniferum]